jgi:DNA-binding response OmpR family regulator
VRILVAEDSPTAAAYLRKKLEEAGHQVVMTKDGREAWEALQARHESLVITDWMMPGMSGLDLCRAIRGRTDWPYTYVILMTVKDLRKDCLDGLLAGADDFLVKPADSIELAAALGAAERVLGAMTALRDRIDRLEAALAESHHGGNFVPAC